LEAVETTGFGHLDLSHEPLGKIFEDDAIGGSKEGQYILNEVLLTLVELFPVVDILSEVNFIYGPEAGHLIFVHFPNVVVLDGQDDEPVGVLFKQGLGKASLGL